MVSDRPGTGSGTEEKVVPLLSSQAAIFPCAGVFQDGVRQVKHKRRKSSGEPGKRGDRQEGGRRAGAIQRPRRRAVSVWTGREPGAGHQLAAFRESRRHPETQKEGGKRLYGQELLHQLEAFPASFSCLSSPSSAPEKS